MTSVQFSTGDRSIVLIGLMGAGKSRVGRRLAERLGVSFADADDEIVKAAGRSIQDIFDSFGEAAFRDGERRIIARLLEHGPSVLAAGGGAFIDPTIRARIAEKGISVWLRADLDLLVRRTSRRGGRPLLKGRNPRDVLDQLMAERHPIYAQADIVIDTSDEPVDSTVTRVIEALSRFRGSGADGSRRSDIDQMETVERLQVDLGERSYDIVIGSDLLDTAGRYLKPLLLRAQVVVVTDDTVAEIHLPRLEKSLRNEGIVHDTVILPAGEATKDFGHLRDLTEMILAAGIERSTTVVALGGGVVGDIAGFAAGILLRGLPYVQIPTTLLAQVDSSVGGKTGINSAQGKNLIGLFHQPRLVLADMATLDTLDLRQTRAGYAEVVKYALIGDRSFFQWLEDNGAALCAGDRDARRFAVRTSCAAKATIVAADEKEGGRRALLNLGHTFAHALEVEIGFGDALLHGEAVALGMVLAFELSARLGLCPQADADAVRRHLAAIGLPTGFSDLPVREWSAEALVGTMMRDKKVSDGRLTLILAHGIGRAFISRDIDPKAVKRLLQDAIAV